ncbi:MAG: endolytic transglycosylase MltG, partial [Clostridia bacterium]|nr:endolytic transglycosylase MltG [Clostridia bacterium]
ELGYEDIARKLTTEGEKAKTVTIRIPEAATIDEIAELMQKNKVCTEEEFIQAVQTGEFEYDFIKNIPTDKVHYRLEGYLFPDTYEFYTYGSITCAEDAVNRMLAETAKHFDAETLSKISAAGRTVHDILTIASIVEMEASAIPAEMPRVAQVFYNRLVWNEPHYLGSSPTAEYPYGEGAYDTNASNPLATEGMPPGPYCAPSSAAIKAAVDPEIGFEMTYFVTDKEMKFYYNNDYRAHINTINKLKREGKWAG